MTVFTSLDDYRRFAHSLRSERRFVHAKHVRSFLDAVAASVTPRVEILVRNTRFWRAQIGSIPGEVVIDASGDTATVDFPLKPERMMPLPTRARENRANPHGIPALYVASHRDTAIAEIGARKHSIVTVASLLATRDLSIVNATLETDHNLWLGNEEPEGEVLERMVWGQIDYAFMRPVTRADDAADYAPTQVLAELFRQLGYDGVAYASSYGEGHNVALFDLESARVEAAQVSRVTDMKLTVNHEYGESYRIPHVDSQ
ncbi:RES family NAD+ phosphorylase [Pseudogemmatithrix spongiicola]|uniref:RES family NAD+ phosphorylase n=1 Tax=Pseudogemmatithrix spongiicola TaxID=3062599 RepID=A0AA49Q8R8_9BACT|nr:RES family NAD+ phosphorylase [Gemmatimonadaceae bacterium 'strain 138']WKW16422.1 RES family NAD+ phosphorylase [Gemmatimonadaceae bacterium 'strain 318']